MPIEDQLAELSDLRDAGKIIGIGMSHVTDDQVTSALPIGPVSVQNIYHRLGREFEPLLELCRDQGIAWTPYFPLGEGGYAGLPKVTDDPIARALAAEVGATPSQIGLAWQLTHAPNTMLIPGTADVQRLLDNLAAGDLVLDAAGLARLDSAGGRRPPSTGGLGRTPWAPRVTSRGKRQLPIRDRVIVLLVFLLARR